MWSTEYKPAGTPVFPNHDGTPGPSALATLLAREPHRQEIPWPAGFEGGICHRLDTPTSGALLVARDLASLEEARRQFRAGEISKVYRLIASREPPWRENRCDRPIAHDPRRKSRMIVQRGASTPHRGRWFPAVTQFAVIRGPLVQADMSTGVTHQIRVHAAFLGIPLAGDRRYGGGEPPPDATDAIPFFLHHVGLVGTGGLATGAVPWPAWAR
jgi:23S rRNA pseudouridine1911/1915/1917 synthase